MMRKTLTVLVAVTALASFACEKSETPASADKAATSEMAPAKVDTAKVDKASSIKTMTVSHLAELVENDKTQVAILDANSSAVRSDYGVIPGAMALSHYKDFDVTAELPKDKDKTLVFYCFNESCGASKQGAAQASNAGHTDVNVLPAGVKGWRDAGHDTVKL